MTEKFRGHYDLWRETRIKKIERELGTEFLKDKTILELGAGHGHIGEYFKETYNCSVTFADGRLDNVAKLRELHSDSNVLHINQELKYDLDVTYDIIIHWGVLYHLNNWKQDLLCASMHGKYIFLETEVCDSNSDTFEIKVNEKKERYDQAVSGIGSRPSAPMVEKYLSELNLTYKRYDSDDLSPDAEDYCHIYNWEVKNTNTWDHGMRRFWIAENKDLKESS